MHTICQSAIELPSCNQWLTNALSAMASRIYEIVNLPNDGPYAKSYFKACMGTKRGVIGTVFQASRDESLDWVTTVPHP